MATRKEIATLWDAPPLPKGAALTPPAQVVARQPEDRIIVRQINPTEITVASVPAGRGWVGGVILVTLLTLLPCVFLIWRYRTAAQQN